MSQNCPNSGVMEAGMTEEVQSLNITYMFTDKLFRSLFSTSMDDSQLDGVLECKRLGCETKLVRICSIQEKLLSYIPVSPTLPDQK